MTATAQPNTTPPSVLLSITETGTPYTTPLTVQRMDADGVTRKVRTPSGAGLDLSSGSATLTDYEYPYGTSVTYILAESTSTTTGTFSMDVLDVWLTHLGVPALSLTVEHAPGTDQDETWALEQGVFPVLERSAPIVVSSGARQAPAMKLLVYAETDAERTALRQLLADGSPLLLNVSPSLGYGVSTSYVAVGNVTATRGVQLATSPLRILTLECQVVDRPEGGTRADYTWVDESAKYATWSAIPAGTTWAQLAAGA